MIVNCHRSLKRVHLSNFYALFLWKVLYLRRIFYTVFNSIDISGEGTAVTSRSCRNELFLIRIGRKKYAGEVCMIFRRHATIVRAFGAAFFGKISLVHFLLENIVITFLTLGYCKFLTQAQIRGTLYYTYIDFEFALRNWSWRVSGMVTKHYI